MKIAHSITISVFCKPEDNKEEVEKALLSLFPFHLENEKIAITKQTAESFNERKITIIEVQLKKGAHINSFIDSLKERFSEEQRDLLTRQLESRLDGEFNFFMRLDKTRLMNDKTCYITDSGDCFHIKISIAAFPKTRESAAAVVKRIFRDI